MASIGHSQELDWSKVAAKKITLFYPGTASWEFLNSTDHSLGAKNIKEGKRACPDCHLDKTSGEVDLRAAEIAAGKLKMKQSRKLFEPAPLAGKSGFLDINVQAAYDTSILYVRFQWKSPGLSWNTPKIAEEGMPDRVSMQLNKGKDYFKRYGCFIACHKDLHSMPDSPSEGEVQNHPYYGPLKRKDVRLYAYYTREDGWAKMKKESDLKALLNEGGLIDLWKAEAHGKEIKVEDWSIFEDRTKDDQADVEGTGKWENGEYTVVMKRKLQTGDSKDVQLKEGDEVPIGIALHDNRANLRKHFVSLPLSIGLGAQGVIKAEKIK
jgi:cytochrome c-type protein NapC